MATTQQAKRKKYNPGLPGRHESLGEGRYRIESFRFSNVWYSVDLNRDTCNCPHSNYRAAKDCKHRSFARFQSYKETRAKAETLPTETLRRALEIHHYRPEQIEAIECELQSRTRETALAA